MCKHPIYIKVIVGVVVLCIAGWFILPMIFRGPLEGDLSHDFGVVLIDRPSSVFEHTFRLKNRTNHPLKLLKASPTCGCTTTEWPRDPVPSGEELILPVQLKLKKSQLRKSEIHLIFDGGERVTLRIQGIGRFRQPILCTPPTVTLSLSEAEDVRRVLRLDWETEEQPPDPVIVAPKGIRVELEQWRFVKAADTVKKTPTNWAIILHFFLEEDFSVDPEMEYFVSVALEEFPELRIPVEITAPKE